MPSTPQYLSTTTDLRATDLSAADLTAAADDLLRAAGFEGLDVIDDITPAAGYDDLDSDDLDPTNTESGELDGLADLDDTSDAGIPDIDDDLLPVLDDDEEDYEVPFTVADADYESFDFEQIIANLYLRDVTGSLATLEAYRMPFVRAARRAARKNPHAEFYNVANAPLFNRRIALKAQLATLETKAAKATKAGKTQPMAAMVELNRVRRDLETLTELIVRFNYGMTRKYVKQFTSNTSREDSLDFQGAANVGLMIAIDSFDPARGKFGNWAYKPIQRAVLKAVRDADFKNMNEGDFEKRPKVRKAYLKLAGPNGENTPTYEEVAAEAGVHIDLVRRILSAPHLESIHTHVGDEGDTELGDLIEDKNAPFEEAVISGLGVAALMEFGLTALDPREHYVLVRVYGLDGETPDALADIGNQLQLSREAIRQIRGKALAKLLHPTTLRKLVRGGRA